MPRAQDRWPCVLTATFRPNAKSATAIRNEAARIREYRDGINFAARCSLADGGLIVVENSGVANEEIDTLIQRLSRQGHTVEFHNLKSPQDEPFHGKGWGEGLMLHNLATRSPLLAAADSFAKVTGRLRIANHRAIARAIRKLRKQHPGLAFVAQDYSTGSKPIINTQFFWSRRDFYENHLGDAYRETNDHHGRFLEHAFAERLSALAYEHAIYVLRMPTIIDGKHGWSGLPVQTRHFQWRLRLRDLFFRRSPPLVNLQTFLRQ